MMTQTDMTRREARLRAASDESIPAIPDAPRTPQGWYADPAVSTHVRWWDGVAWSDHVRPAPGVPTVTETDVVPQFDPGPESPPPSSLMGVRSGWVATPAPREWHTTWAWGLAFSPLLLVAVQLIVAFITIAATGTAATVGSGAAGLFALAVLIVRDRAELLKRGYVRPASSFWGLLGPLGYLIARTIKLRRAVGHGSAPLWWFLGSSAATLALSGVLLLASGILGVLAGALTDDRSTGQIQAAVQAELVAQGYATSVLQCPETADLSPNASFDCTVFDSAQPTVPATVRITMNDDGASYVASFVQPGDES